MKHPPRNIAIDWINTIWSTCLDSESKLIACNLRRYMNAQNDMAWPSNARIQGETGLSESTVRRRLHHLCEEGWIVDTGASQYGTRIYQAAFPKMKVGGVSVGQGVSVGLDTPVSVTPELNKELNNTTTTKKKRFVKPTLEEVKAYAAEKQFKVDTDYFFEFYTTANWKDAGDKQVKNWKLKLLTWNKREQKNGTNRQGSAKRTSGVTTRRASEYLD